MKISTTKPTRIKVTEYDAYKLEPAASRSHYGAPNSGARSNGGEPYAYPVKKTTDTWFVCSGVDGRVLGTLTEYNDDDWAFSKVRGLREQMPQWLKGQSQGIVGSSYYKLEARIYSSPTPEGAIAAGLGIVSRKSPAEIKAEIDAFREKSWNE